MKKYISELGFNKPTIIKTALLILLFDYLIYPPYRNAKGDYEMGHWFIWEEINLRYITVDYKTLFIEYILNNSIKNITNIKDRWGHTPLHEACINENENAVNLLLHYNSKLLLSEEESFLIMTNLIKNVKYEKIKLFIKCGININIKNYREIGILEIIKYANDNELNKFLSYF